MKIRGGQERQGVKLDMTSMIDIVFQLLVFFVMTFKVTALEGDFNINMPLASSESPEEIEFEPLDNLISIRLVEREDHSLGEIQVNFKQEFTTHSNEDGNACQLLRQQIREIVEQAADPSITAELEVEFDIDPNLYYGETVQAIEHVSARREGRQIIPLIEKIKFKDSL